MSKPRKILLLIESGRGFGRDLIAGIAGYARFHGPWSFYTYPPFFRAMETNREILYRLKNEGIDGIISREMAEFRDIARMNIPVIFATTIRPKDVEVPDKYPIMTSDDKQIGKLAAEHLLNCGFKHFAYCGYHNIGWSQDRAATFEKTLNAGGHYVHFYEHPKNKKHQHWEHEQAVLVSWLHSLPKPTGIMTCSDDRSRDLIEAAKIAGIRVPEDVGVIGVDNDKLVCELANPTLSSVSMDTENAGYRAAELLDKLMSGEEILSGQKIFIHPRFIEVRHSTDVLIVDDAEVISAMRYIREHVREPITVEAVVESTCLSRRSLERRFERMIGRSIHKEISRVRIEQISRMLLESNMSQLQIAHAMGFSSIDNFRRFFHRETGVTPLEYRKQHRRVVDTS